MKIVNKIIAATLIFGIIAGITACGNNADKQGTASEATSQKKVVKIAYLPLTHALPVFC